MRIEEAVSILSKPSNALIISTDTVYGILSTSTETIEKLKRREPGKKKIVRLVGRKDALGKDIPEDLREIIDRF